MGVVRPAEADARDGLLPQRRGRRDALRPRGRRASSTPTSGRSATARATTSSCRSARPGAWRPTRAAPSGCSTSSARPRSSRRSATATTTASCWSTRPYSQRDIRLPDEVPARTDEGDFRVHVKMRNRLTAYHYTPPPVRRRRLGWLPLAVRLQHRRLRADHRARPPAAAGPPDVRGAELRRLLVRAAQVRLSPAGDPGAVQPLEHQLGRGHLLRRRQLHEPSRRGDRVVHAPPGRASRTVRIRAPPRPRSARRRPRSWR